MRTVKVLQFRYTASAELAPLLEDFRLMCNDAIRIALTYEKEHDGQKVKNRFMLIELAYARLKEYGLHTHYILSACEVAYSAYRNKDRKSAPYFKAAFLKLDNQTYSLNHLLLRIPTTPRHFLYLTLQGSDYHLSHTEDPSLRRGSITLTDRNLNIALSKETTEVEPLGQIGVDVNEENVTTSDWSGRTVRYDTSEIVELKGRYKAIRAKIGRRTRQDDCVSQRLYAKYGRRESNRTTQRLHSVTKAIVKNAEKNRFAIVLEKLKGIRKLYRRGNGQGASYRGRLSGWTFHEIQRQIEYKARWNGIPVTYVNPRGTSRKCPECGSSLVELEGRRLMCPSCKKTGDRDVIASKNIMAAVVPAARPSKRSGEGEPRRQKSGNPPSRWMEVTIGHEPKS